MLKKLTLLAMSVAALLAFAAPLAQASGPLVTNSLGEAAKKIVATSENTKTVTANGTLECNTVILNGTVEENANTTAKGSGSGEAKGTVPADLHTGHCATSSGVVVNITAINISSLHLTKHGAETTGTASFTYTYDLVILGFPVHCVFSGTNVPVKRTGASAINVAGELTKSSGGSFCPSTGTLSGDFTVAADGLGAATIH